MISVKCNDHYIATVEMNCQVAEYRIQYGIGQRTVTTYACAPEQLEKAVLYTELACKALCMHSPVI